MSHALHAPPSPSHLDNPEYAKHDSRTMMNYLASICLAFTFLLLTGCAGGHRIDSQTALASDTVAAILEREQAWADAMRGHDLETLHNIMGTDFRLASVEPPPFAQGDSPGLPRAMWLENLRFMTFGPITMQHQRVTLHGDNVATVRMRMTLEQWRFHDALLPPVYDLLDTWVYRDGRWQVIGRISELLTPDSTSPKGS